MDSDHLTQSTLKFKRMKRFFNIPNETKSRIFTEINYELGMATHAVEKDWWVVQVLTVIFEMEIGEHLVFKGGTSLSKSWGLIERFSEDIDLAIDRKFLGFEGELSKKNITALRKEANKYITDTFFPELQKRFEEKELSGLKWEILSTTESDQDPKIINLYYPSAIEHTKYIQPKVQIEIGCRSLREPFTICEIRSLVDEYYPEMDFAQMAILVPTVNAERTFLEKIMLLHEEFSKPPEQVRVNRLSRHLFDVYQLAKSGFLEKIIHNKELYETIVKHRHRFTKISGVDYNLHQPQTINPIPPEFVIDEWKKDYKTMQEEMIYSESPDFDDLIKELIQLKQKLNTIEWKFDIVF